MQHFLKILSEMSNSVDPDQTAPSGAVRSGSAMFTYAILSETLVYGIFGRLPYNNVLITFSFVTDRLQPAEFKY